MYPQCEVPECQGPIAIARWQLGYRTCLTCAEKQAKQIAAKHTIVPMHKSNYVHMTAESARELLKGINSKTHRG